MSVTAALDDIDDVVTETFDLQTRRQAKQKEGSRRNVYERSLREMRQVAGTGEMRQLQSWIGEYIAEKERFPTSREVRKEGARICRENGSEIPTGSWLGA
ncbi:hypothetical protein [Haloprofundus salinisoli]|uniref:hypothetical protein n=1 Tax=Haloprofundus salinisoli TaxID=2876193 RepID=UPI001CC99B06|nr:hypothetical protein [Haloprofundus salinisoli]